MGTEGLKAPHRAWAGAPMRLALALVSATLVLLAVAARADAFVYWTNFGTGTIGRANLEGTGVNESFVTAGVPNLRMLAADESYLYWTRLAPFPSTNQSLGRARLDGSDVNSNFIANNDNNTDFGIAVDDSHIYWASTNTSIARADLDGGAINLDFHRDR